MTTVILVTLHFRRMQRLFCLATRSSRLCSKPRIATIVFQTLINRLCNIGLIYHQAAVMNVDPNLTIIENSQLTVSSVGISIYGHNVRMENSSSRHGQ